MTDPNNRDTDGDGLGDGVEDKNRNGWTDGDGASLATSANPTLARAWPNNKIDAGETWTETSPIKADSDADELSDGFGEDKDFDGVIDGDTDADRAYDAGELWSGDGSAQGRHGRRWAARRLGIAQRPRSARQRHRQPAHRRRGRWQSRTTAAPAIPTATASRTRRNSPTAPTRIQPDTGVPPPPNSIVIGPQQPPVVVGGVSNAKEFTDWTFDDLIVLDEYDGDGPNNQGSDVYHGYDGFDSSRDIVAFYAHDGGDTAQPAATAISISASTCATSRPSPKTEISTSTSSSIRAIRRAANTRCRITWTWPPRCAGRLWSPSIRATTGASMSIRRARTTRSSLGQSPRLLRRRRARSERAEWIQEGLLQQRTRRGGVLH